MRKIKFRAWYRGRYYYFSLETVVEGFGDDCPFYPKSESLSFNYLDAIIEEYTGLHDKNSVDIYEGDILRGPVDFGPGGEHVWTFQAGLDEYGPTFQTWPWKEKREDAIPEVVGNIWENPELLEE
jgi:hypothetical protein